MKGDRPGTSEIAEIRTDLEELLPDEATIQRVAEESDGGGGTTEDWSDLAFVMCRIDPRGGGEGGSAGDRLDSRTTHCVTVAAGTDVVETDRLVISDTTHEVLLVETGGEYELVRKVQTKELF